MSCCDMGSHRTAVMSVVIVVVVMGSHTYVEEKHTHCEHLDMLKTQLYCKLKYMNTDQHPMCVSRIPHCTAALLLPFVRSRSLLSGWICWKNTFALTASSTLALWSAFDTCAEDQLNWTWRDSFACCEKQFSPCWLRFVHQLSLSL